MSTKPPCDSEPEQSNPPPGTEPETKQPLPSLGKEDNGSRTFTMRELLSELKTEGGDDYSTTPHSQGSARQSYQLELNSVAMELINSITCMDEESRSRQRSLTYAARRWAIEIERNPEDHEALYNLGLILQDSANNVSPDSTSPSKHALLEEACKNYEEATRLNPTLDEALYNWAMAITDRAKMRGRTKEAEELWKQAAINYEKAVRLNWKYPQAINNWGLALQELSATVPAREKPTIVRKAISKFRAAIRLQFDFHRAIYNLGTVLYALAEDTFRTQGAENANELYSQSSIYIVAAHAMKPNYSVYSSALGVVRSMLPLPYLKVGYLKAHPAGKPISPNCNWKISQFLLNHEGLQQISKEDEEKQARRNLPRSGEIPNGDKRTITVNIPDILSVTECADLSLPPGPALWINTIRESVFLIADSWDSLDGWLDAIRLVCTIYAKGHSEVLAGIVTS